MHGVEDKIRRAVHDAGKGGDLVKAQDTLEIHKPRDAAADRGCAAEGNTLLARQLSELAVVMRN